MMMQTTEARLRPDYSLTCWPGALIGSLSNEVATRRRSRRKYISLLQLVIVIILVPIKLSQCQHHHRHQHHQQQQQQPQILTKTINLNQQPISSRIQATIPDLIRANQLQLQQQQQPQQQHRHNHQQQQPKQHNVVSNEQRNRRNDLQQEISNGELQQIIQEQQILDDQQQQQQQQPKAARQLFVSDFVSNQGHKSILKNFVNNTLAELVANRQPIVSGSRTLSRFIQASNHRQPPLSLIPGDHQLSTTTIGLPNETANRLEQRPYLPAIGKLYSFLFPNQNQNQQQQQQQQLEQLEQTRVKDSSSHQVGDELIEPSSSDSMDLYESTADSADQFGARAAATAAAATTKGKFISLSAPYEPKNRARTSLLQVNDLPLFDLASNESKWRRDKSNETFVAYPEQDNEQQLQQQQHHDHHQQQQLNTDTANLIEGEEVDGSSHHHSPVASMIQEDSQPEMIQSGQQQADQEQEEQTMNDHEGMMNNQNGPEFKFVDEQNQNANNLMEYEPQEYNHLSSHQTTDNLQRHNKSSFLNNQIDHHHHHNRPNESTSSDTHHADTFFHQLPSTYDSPMRVPPEGYYDDYYKLASSQTTGYQQAPQMDSLLPPPSDEQQITTVHHQTVINGNQTADEQQHLISTSINSTKAEHSTFSNHTPENQLMEGHQLNQFYLNQTPMKGQKDEPSDQRAEFIAPRNQTIQTNYIHTNISVANHQNQNGNIKYTEDSSKHQAQHQQQQQQQEQDNIQLIIANTNSSFDPINNEKVINYMSEGKNVTLLQPSSGKSPRHTFVNKEMNELPPASPDNHSNHHDDQSNNSSYQEVVPLQVSGSHVTQTSTTTPSSYLQVNNINNNDNNNAAIEQYIGSRRPSSSMLNNFYLPSKEFNPDANNRRRATTESSLSANEGTESTESTESDHPDNHNEYELPIQPVNSLQKATVQGDDYGDDTDTLRRLSSESGQQTSYGQYNQRNPNSSSKSNHKVTSAGNSRQQHKMNKSKRTYDARNVDLATNENNTRRDRGQHQNSGVRQGESNHHHHQRKRRQQNMRQQQTIRRPQMTEANFNPKDLIVSKPTPQPSVTESALETITELPTKVKKLREQQPDKNELMNELLTALDRVKVAIYKLQPLTAKMNAIYRKSVTSNTRDTVLDNHKGTYAKRYPPGDYDDNYDRMHPSELLISRTNPSASSRKGRRTPTRHPRRMMTDDQMAEESTTGATYLPAPKDMLIGNLTNSSTGMEPPSPAPFSPSGTRIEIESDLATVSSSSDEDELVATGIGRRLGDGRLKGEVVSFGLSGDDEDLRQRLADQFADSPSQRSANSTSSSSSSPSQATVISSDSSPTFGYRITIYRSPVDEDSQSSDQVDDGGDESPSASERLSYSFGGESPLTLSTIDDGHQDSMVTSESSIVESTSTEMNNPNPTTTNGTITATKNHATSATEVIADEGETLRGDESQEQKNKKKMEEKGKREKVGNKEDKKKKGDEESKKKKEYKKIKHNKGLISKESKKMHRDKHIKAHDRGAAKEKALKERTQIEFFEREQIVDDEYEKGKKSTMKAGWQSGHDAKRSKKDISGISGGDSMSMGGSHFVAHEQPLASFSEKGQGSSVETSSNKKSNKFEKKDLESKGKKFKGWREKGYKIITETEFIDRGSLHDSAYKKRDKGAAHHQKYKKQEANSEGHHGSMIEHHKKSHKKEEKKENIHEKGHMKKGEEKKKGGSEKKKRVKKEEVDEEESMLAATMRPSDATIELMNRNQRSRQPISVSSQAAWQFAPNHRGSQDTNPNHQQQSSALLRLLNAEHDTKPTTSRLADSNSADNNYSPISIGQRSNATSKSNHYRHQPDRSESAVGHESNRTDEGSLRRSDDANGINSSNTNIVQQHRPNGTSTYFDIIDNFSGQKINKTRVGTYEVDDQMTRQTIMGDPKSQRHPNSTQYHPGSQFPVPEPGGSRQSTPVIRMQQQQQQQPNHTTTTTTSTTTTTTTTEKPRQLINEGSSNGDKSSRVADLHKLISLLRAEHIARRQSESNTSKSLFEKFNPLNNPVNNNQQSFMTALAQQNNNNNYLPAVVNKPSNNIGVAAAQAFLQQLAQRASSSATINGNLHTNNPSEMLDFTGNTFIPPNDHFQQTTSFLSQTPPLPMSAAASNYQQQQVSSYSFPPPAGQFEFSHPINQQANSILFPNDQLLDYDPDTLLAPSPQTHTFATD